MRRIRGARALLAGATLIAASIVPAAIATPAAHAGAVDNVCTITATLNFEPPLTTSQQFQNMTLTNATAYNCTNPDYTGATITLNSGSGSSLCLVLQITGSGQFNWNNGQASDFNYIVSTNPVTGSIGLEAEIISGPFQGDTIQDVPIVVSIDGACLTPLDSLTLNSGELIFTSL